jgi:2-methylaconitate cis-trans-isomerase PrpF
MKRFVAALSLAVTAQTVFAAPETQIQDGLWEITTETEIPGTPTRPAAETIRTCYTKADVAEGAMVPKGEQCEVLDYRLSGNTAKWNIRCAGQNPVTGSGTIVFSSRSAYSGTLQLRLQADGQPEIRMNNRYAAKRIGACAD